MVMEKNLNVSKVYKYSSHSPQVSIVTKHEYFAICMFFIYTNVRNIPSLVSGASPPTKIFLALGLDS